MPAKKAAPKPAKETTLKKATKRPEHGEGPKTRSQEAKVKLRPTTKAAQKKEVAAAKTETKAHQRLQQLMPSKRVRMSDACQVMDKKNITSITTVHLLGLQLPQIMSFLGCSIFLLMSGVTICGNLLIITAVSYSKTLHCPMYFLLSQLSVLDILVVMDLLPTMLYTLLADVAIIMFSACLTQLFFFALSEGVELLLLTVMSYDRYLAICKPLHYTLIMTHQVCWRMVIITWMLGLIAGLDTLMVLKLQFCGPNIIDNFFCDLEPILDLSCTDTTMVQYEVKLIGAIVCVITFCIIIVSYIYIVASIIEISSFTGRKKVFSTCSSHLTVVALFYGTIFSVYLVPHKGEFRRTAKFLSLLYTVVTPMMNPIIYSLRNKDLKNAIEKLITYLTNIYFK
ncbi:olfactory receptor 1468-like [Gastrophryne carolinensis]